MGFISDGKSARVGFTVPNSNHWNDAKKDAGTESYREARGVAEPHSACRIDMQADVSLAACHSPDGVSSKSYHYA